MSVPVNFDPNGNGWALRPSVDEYSVPVVCPPPPVWSVSPPLHRPTRMRTQPALADLTNLIILKKEISAMEAENANLGRAVTRQQKLVTGLCHLIETAKL